jgi:DNA-binding response OmpR family regulator
LERSILIVDDDHALVEVLVQLLDEEGYRVSYAFDGQTALQELVHAPPDLILSDVMMPNVDGVSLVRRLRLMGSTIPVVFMSAVYIGVALPDLTFVHKPFDLDTLLEVVRRALHDGTEP